ncbi:hypothetical protein [Corynebacterium kalidii]
MGGTGDGTIRVRVTVPTAASAVPVFAVLVALLFLTAVSVGPATPA